MTRDRTAAAVADVVAAMDRLRTGCPWDAEQTHASLAPYAVEEAHEVAEAAERGDRTALREELGDLLLQVVFHARIAEEDPAAPFDLADVARTLHAKLVRRHPHVFGDGAAATAAEVEQEWERIKGAERAAGADPLATVPVSLPALARTQKVLRRLRRAGLAVEPPAPTTPAERYGAALAELVARADAEGVDAEAALRGHVRALVERAGRTDAE